MKKVTITTTVTGTGYTREVEYKGKTYKQEFKKTKLGKFPGVVSIGPNLKEQGLPDFINDNIEDAFELSLILNKR